MVFYTCCMVADFRAFKDYLALGFDVHSVALSVRKNVPLSHPLLGALPQEYQKPSYLMINFAAATDGPRMREEMAQGLYRQLSLPAGVSPDGAPFDPRVGMPLGNLRQSIDMAARFPAFGSAGGGAAMPLVSTVLLDSRTIREMGYAFMPSASERDLTFYQNFVEHHEASHLMLGLREPGSDFVAAALSLRKTRNRAACCASGRTRG